MVDINDILTLQEVADYLKIAPKTVQRMIGRNEIPCMKIAGQWRFRKHVIDAWLNSKMTFSEEHSFADMMEVPGTIMQLSRLIQTDFILMDMKAASVEQTLTELTAPLAEHNFVDTTAALVTRWRFVTEIGSVYPVHLVEIPHVCEINLHFHAVVKTASGLLKNSLQVLHTLPCLGFDVRSGELSSRRINWYLS